MDVSGREALCLYGNPEGISYLKRHVDFDIKRVELDLKVVEGSQKYNNPPEYAGFWSYYKERYLLKVLDKDSKKELISMIMACDYGFEGPKQSSYHNLELKKYGMKQCRLIKVMPVSFASLPLPSKCASLRIDL